LIILIKFDIERHFLPILSVYTITLLKVMIYYSILTSKGATMTTNNKQIISNTLLDALRVSKSLTIQELANLVGLPYQTVRRLCSSAGAPRSSSMARLLTVFPGISSLKWRKYSRLLKTSPDELLGLVNSCYTEFTDVNSSTDSRQVSFYLHEEYIQGLANLSLVLGKSQSHIIRDCIQELMAKHSVTELDSLDPVIVTTPISSMMRLVSTSASDPTYRNVFGDPLNSEHVTQLCNLFSKHYSKALEQPLVEPVGSGLVCFRWELSNWDLSLVIDLATKHAELSGNNITTLEDTITEWRADLNLPKDWERLRELITRLA
jgi:hypothetical protein